MDGIGSSVRASRPISVHTIRSATGDEDERVRWIGRLVEPAPEPGEPGELAGSERRAERWLRVLEVTLRLGGYVARRERSLDAALRPEIGDDGSEPPRAVVLDLGTETSAAETEDIRRQLGGTATRMVVVLPNRMADERSAFEAAGAQVLIRPYAPTELYKALGEAEPAVGEWAREAPASADS